MRTRSRGRRRAGAAGPSGTTSAPATTPAGTPSSGAPSSGTPDTGTGSVSPGGKADPSASTGSKGSGGTSGDSGNGDRGAARACADPDLSIGTSYWRMDSGQHLLITATNISGSACTLYHYPLIGLGSEDPIGPLESPAKALATIRPKQKAYAGLRLFRPGEKTTTVTSFSLAYQERVTNTGDEGAPLDIALSPEVEFLNVGPTPGVTFWNTDRSAIEGYLFRGASS
ncbi:MULTISPECIES: DUF4232 domain-containing protein [unclassified Streptomyces]|uniref:DUF4232 domain-containing protein n=1 Tax=unclassified Streptomyces TaxID=2593676 RepID=UPI0006F69D54|nr:MULTISPECIES: DUF4232 domain-containing protein [unclassified Streptomyces]KQX55759.1 hypothetical protein ASD33_30745 [Streptomyces sp. Root1304]KRA96356.1 hypothetical protein ASE09_27510 [Streptomyces sp. Root66D1]